jgi:hypothetical protein
MTRFPTGSLNLAWKGRGHSAIRLTVRRFEIASENFVDLIAPLTQFRFESDGRRARSGLDDLEDRRFDRVIDPQAAEGDAARLAIVEQTSMTDVARNVDFMAV